MSRLAASLFVAAVVAAACTTVDDPQGLPGTGGGDGTGGAIVGGPCEPEGAERECKVDIDAHNCFVGVQRCEDGAWGDCREAEMQQKAIGPQAPCTTNPCNATCEQFDENPMAPLESTYTGSPPASMGGQILGLPDSWKDILLKDQDHVGDDCTTLGDCNADFYCNGAGTTCEPWQPGEYDNTAGAANLTVPIVCGNTIQVCNRGSVQAPAGVEVNVFDATDPTDVGKCTGFNNPLRGSCTTTQALDPGECTYVTGCNGFLGGPGDTALIHVNGADQAPPPPIAESNCADSWGIYYDGGTCLCANTTIQADVTAATMYLFLDNSGSMNTGGATDLWDNAKAAVTTFVQDPDSASYNVAWRMFGSGCCDNNCAGAAGSCATPQFGPDFLSNVTHQNNIIGSMPANAPGGCGTPLGPVVTGIVNWASARKTAFPTEAVGGVLITDGDFSGCSPSTTAATAMITSAAYNGGLGPSFYVVALNGADITFCQQVSEPDSNCIDLRFSATPGADLVDALDLISGQLAGCNLAIPNLGQIDLATAQVDYSPGGVPPPITLNNVGDLGSCMPPSDDEIYFDDPANPTAILMCPDTCNTIKSDPNALIEFTAGCQSGAGYQSGSFNYEYQADCSSYGSGVGATWDFFAYDTTIPADASVVFEVRTADTQTGLAAASWTTVATATAASQVVTMANPVLLSDYLTGPLLRNDWLELQITINPDSGGTQTATVNNWDLSFTCLDNE